MTPAPYVDTSALAKWFLNEPRSEDFVAYVSGLQEVAISRLTALELRYLLARRRRAKTISAAIERRVLAAFEDDIRDGVIFVQPVDDRHVVLAAQLLASLARHPLRTLDALHLAIARDSGAPAVATADRVMADAAAAMGFEVARFD